MTPSNADCPCGSGKKFKKCCERPRESAFVAEARKEQEAALRDESRDFNSMGKAMEKFPRPWQEEVANEVEAMWARYRSRCSLAFRDADKSPDSWLAVKKRRLADARKDLVEDAWEIAGRLKHLAFSVGNR